MRGFCFTSHELFWLESVCCLSTSSLSESLTFHIFIFFSRTAGPISTNLSSNHHWVKGVQVCSKKGHAFLKRIIMYDYWTFVDIFQNSSFQKQFVQKKKSSITVDSGLFKSWTQGNVGKYWAKRGVGMGARITTYEDKELNLKKSIQPKKA